MSGEQLAQRWLARASASKADTARDQPNYWSSNFHDLVSSTTVHNISLGTGESIYSKTILPLVETAEQEVILVTCFWAQSKTLQALNDALLKLSAKATQAGRRQIRVRIYFSSSSLTQKLFHPQTLQGRTYEPSVWKSKLGLPEADELPGLEMQVKSIFMLPFSVMHPKFVIVDRRRALLPSCNVSWEDWFEGCVELSGPIVGQFVRFWQKFWAHDGEDVAIDAKYTVYDAADAVVAPSTLSKTLASRDLDVKDATALFLPSPHHRNPRFALMPWQACPPPPPTPLNTFLLEAIVNAQKTIYIQTPNLTAPPVLSALLAALRRGVNVTILTSEELMVLEQLVTAGTTTARCMRKLVKLHRRLCRHDLSHPSSVEAATRSGKLRISYYQPLPQHLRATDTPEPVQSHLKLTVVDTEWVLLGSGNLDRASLFTSQELGVAFHSQRLAATVGDEVGRLMEGRRKVVYDSAARG